ncbi:MAG: glycosyl hydrolase [Nibricoccus sp.]
MQYAATNNKQILTVGIEGTRRFLVPPSNQFAPPDHGFNHIPTLGNLYFFGRVGLLENSEDEIHFYEINLKNAGLNEAARWTNLPQGFGYLHSVYGTHSLTAETIRSLRLLAVSHLLGGELLDEEGCQSSLLSRVLIHAATTARYNVYLAEGRDHYDVNGRVAYESLFNLDGSYRRSGAAQGYSPFTTWMRGLAWTLLGFSELLEFLDIIPASEFFSHGGKAHVLKQFLKTAKATADFYIQHTPTDGVPYWDSGAPNLKYLKDFLDRPAEPFNPHEPVDSSAAAIAAQGLIRLGNYLKEAQDKKAGSYYLTAGLTVAKTIFSEQYISSAIKHQGLLLHSAPYYPFSNNPNYKASKIPNGESCTWGDYHTLELALLIHRMALGRYYTFFGL